MDNELDMIVHVFNPSITTKTAVAKLSVCLAFTRLWMQSPSAHACNPNNEEVEAEQTQIQGPRLQLYSQSGLGNLPEASLPFFVITSGLPIYTTIQARKIGSHQTAGSSHNSIEAPVQKCEFLFINSDHLVKVT